MTSPVSSSSNRTRQHRPQPSQRLSHSGTVICSRVLRFQKGSPGMGAIYLAPSPEAITEARLMRAPILALKDVRLADGQVMLFDGVDLALEPRTRACLVGRNGAG